MRRKGATQRGVQNIEMLIKDASAFIEDAQRVITEVAQVCQQGHGAAQVFPVFNVEVSVLTRRSELFPYSRISSGLTALTNTPDA